MVTLSPRHLGFSIALVAVVITTGCGCPSRAGDGAIAQVASDPMVSPAAPAPVAVPSTPVVQVKQLRTEGGHLVPEAVASSARRVAGDAEVRFSDLAQGGEEFEDWYDAFFRTDSGGGELKIRPTGEIFEGFVEMPPSKFPQAARLALEKRAPNARILTSGMAITPELTMYGAEVEFDNQEWELGFDAEGKLVHEKRER